MKRKDYDLKALDQAKRADRQVSVRPGRQCLICRSWRNPCTACKPAQNGKVRDTAWFRSL